MKTQTNQQVARNARTAIVRRLEGMHPNMVVLAGPFEIQSQWPETREREIAHCTKMKEEFQKAKVPVKVVLSAVGAWVLRAKDGMHTVQTVQLKKYALKLRRVRGSKKGAHEA